MSDEKIATKPTDNKPLVTKSTFLDGFKTNFETLSKAFTNGDVCMAECTVKATGETVAVLCAGYVDKEQNVNLVPLAQMLSGNPFEEIQPPK